MASILFSYAVSLLICGGLIFGVVFLAKKNKTQFSKKIHCGMLFLGIVLAVVSFLVMTLLYKWTFDNANYYNTPLFRGLVGTVYVFLLCITLALLAKSIFFDRFKEGKGFSLLLGFGIAPGAFMMIYLILMVFVVGLNGIFNGPCVVGSDGQLCFADNTIIGVFRPAAGHISYTVLFGIFSLLSFIESILLNELSRRNIPIYVKACWVAMFSLLMAMDITMIRFSSMYGLSHWQLALISLILFGGAVLIVKFLPKEKTSTIYTKQFE